VRRSCVQRTIKLGIGRRLARFGNGPTGRPVKLEGETSFLRRGLDGRQRRVVGVRVSSVRRIFRAYSRGRIQAPGIFL